MRNPPPTAQVKELEGVSPLDVMLRWPHDHPLAMLHSGRVHPRWARWSILAQPRVNWRFDGRSQWLTARGNEVPAWTSRIQFTNDPLIDLDAILNATQTSCDSQRESLPFVGGWIGFFGYELGGIIEPSAIFRDESKYSTWPMIDLAWCPDALIFDHVKYTWHAVGDCASIIHQLCHPREENSASNYTLHPPASSIRPSTYRDLVSRTIEYIRAGDIFQANIAQKFSAPIEGSLRALAIESLRRSQAWYGAYLELHPFAGEERAIISMSPELFVQIDVASRTITTRPIKGTRPASANARELLESPKDAAELHMIVDLMRNDLGRLCEFGSVHVPHSRLIETHPTVHHGVGEIRGTLRKSASLADILRATFPAGSITGAPKIRAMQIIDELEREPRGPYCGSIGFISDCGDVTLNVAIRTMLLRGSNVHNSPDRHFNGVLDYWAGAGIVADSHAELEYHECVAKTALLQTLADASTNLTGAAQTHERHRPTVSVTHEEG